MLSFRALLICMLLLLPSVGFASSTDGTISSSANNTARFKDSAFGYINFGLSSGNVHLTDSVLTGYAWGDFVGWINLAPSGGGVTNNGEGTLSGYAWGEQTGWINFAPTNGGVTVDSSGDFAGYAWSENYGWVVFNCATDSTCSSYDHKVNIDWRPRGARPACNNATDDDSDGATDYPTDTGCTSADDTSEVNATVVLGGGGAAGSFGFVIPAITLPPPIPPPEPTPDVVIPPPTPDIPPPVKTPTQITDVASSPAPTSGSASGVSGAGGSGGSGGGVIFDTFTAARQQVSESIAIATDVIINTAKDIKQAINTPVGSAVTKTVSTVGAIGGGVVTASALFVNPLSVSELFLIPLRLWALLLATFGLKKRHRPWGTVYDSVTKQPLDPAYVVLKDASGNELSASITDLDGRYGFLLNPGSYTIVANKTHYSFPSKKLAGKVADELYSDLYFGEPLSVAELGGVVSKNIPLDPEKLDWNEVTKGSRNLMKFYTRHDRAIRKFTDAFFAIGFGISLLALLASPQGYNIATFAVYVVLALLRIAGFTSKPYGGVRMKNTGEPLAFAIVRIFASGVDTEVAQKVTDKFGRYYALVPDTGEYYVTIERKNPDESYTQVFKSEPIVAVKGIIDREFEVEE